MQIPDRGRLPLAATALVLALTACGGDDSGTESATEVDTTGFVYGEVPTENSQGPSIDESQMPPEPERGAPRHEQNTHTALVKVSELTWTADPDATSECPEVDLHEEGSYTCVVTYMGEEFEYLVELDEDGAYRIGRAYVEEFEPRSIADARPCDTSLSRRLATTSDSRIPTVAMTRVERKERRKKKRTSVARTPPMTAFWLHIGTLMNERTLPA